VMVLMCFALVKAVFNDIRREQAGIATVVSEIEDGATPAE